MIAALLASSIGAAAGLVDELEADLSTGRLLKRAPDGGFHPTASWRKSPEELLSGIAEYRRLVPKFAKLDGYATGADGEKAWRDATGKNPTEEYAALCEELWKTKTN